MPGLSSLVEHFDDKGGAKAKVTVAHVVAKKQ
jgi:hypothetical protein